MKYDIFISCKSEDYHLGGQVYEFLINHRSLNRNVFFADKTLNQEGNSDYGDEIDKALDSSTHLIIVSSNAEYLKKESSSYVYEEWHSFLEEMRSGRKNGQILTIFTNDVNMNDVPYAIRNRQSFPFTNFSSIIDYLTKNVEKEEEKEKKPLKKVAPLSNIKVAPITDETDDDLDYDDAVEFMKNGELQEAMYSLQASFENGNTKAIPLFNKLLFRNFGKIDWDKETWEFLEQQAEAGNSFAHLAFFYKYLHNKEEHQQAATYLQTAYNCDKENGYAILCQGIAMERGIGEHPKLLKAKRRYEQAYNKKGISEACSYVAEMYLNGNSGQAIDENKALEILEKGCENDDARSYFILGAYYSKNAHIEECWEKAIKYFQKAADLQEYEAWIKLGKLYHYKRFSEEYNGKELSCYNEAVKYGIKDAHAYIAQIRWDEGSQQEAIIQAQKGEKKGSVLSISKLGSFYEKGLQVEEHWMREDKPDFAKAWDYYRKAFNLGGRPEDAISMARLYVKEEHRPQDVSWDTIERYLEQGVEVPIIEALDLLIEVLKENGKEGDTRKYLGICAKSGSLEMMHKYGIYAQSSEKSGEALKLIEDAGDKNYRPSIEWLMDYYKNREPSKIDYGKWMDKAVETGIEVPLHDYIPHIINDKNKDKDKVVKYLQTKYSNENIEALYWMAKHRQEFNVDVQWLLQELKKHYIDIAANQPIIYEIYANLLIDSKNDEEYNLFLHEIAKTSQSTSEYFALYKEIREINGKKSEDFIHMLHVLSQDMSLPYIWREKAKGLVSQSITNSLDRRNIKILVVDDIWSNIIFLKILLTNEKFTVYTANNGKICLEMAKKEKPDLILLAIMMPEINGFEVASILKNDPETKDIAIIFLSSLRTESELERAFQIGVEGYITKPFVKEELLMRVYQLSMLAKYRKIIPIEEQEMESPKILLVDDVQTNLLLMEILLHSEGYQVVTANNGNTCIELAKKEQPDIITLDVMMPDINGFDLAVILKKDPETMNIPIIFITALPNITDIVHGYQVGGDDYITKPFNKKELPMHIKNILTVHRYIKQISTWQ